MDSFGELGLRFFISRLFSFQPSIKKVGGTLVATSDWRSHLLCLGFAGRRVIVDPTLQIIRIRRRILWFYQISRRIEFNWISEVLYSYADTDTGWGEGQPAELYTVGIQLKNGESIPLFRFFGEGDFVNNTILPDWMYWGDMLIAEVTKRPQDRNSLLFADLIAGLVGVPISNPMP